jgi:hypothetical protein
VINSRPAMEFVASVPPIPLLAQVLSPQVFEPFLAVASAAQNLMLVLRTDKLGFQCLLVRWKYE